MAHHAAGLRRLIQAEPSNAHLREEQIDLLLQDFRRAKLGPEDRAMLEYTDKLTREPWAMVEADVDELRQAGFCDNGILDICQVAAYYAFVNRLADGLGVELEPFHEPPQGETEL